MRGRRFWLVALSGYSPCSKLWLSPPASVAKRRKFNCLRLGRRRRRR